MSSPQKLKFLKCSLNLSDLAFCSSSESQPPTQMLESKLTWSITNAFSSHWTYNQAQSSKKLGYFCYKNYPHIKRNILQYHCSIAKSCPILCDPVNCSTPHFPVFHYLWELTQTWVRDAIQPSHSLLPLILHSAICYQKINSSSSAQSLIWSTSYFCEFKRKSVLIREKWL